VGQGTVFAGQTTPSNIVHQPYNTLSAINRLPSLWLPSYRLDPRPKNAEGFRLPGSPSSPAAEPSPSILPSAKSLGSAREGERVYVCACACWGGGGGASQAGQQHRAFAQYKGMVKIGRLVIPAAPEPPPAPPVPVPGPGDCLGRTGVPVADVDGEPEGWAQPPLPPAPALALGPGDDKASPPVGRALLTSKNIPWPGNSRQQGEACVGCEAHKLWHVRTKPSAQPLREGAAGKAVIAHLRLGFLALPRRDGCRV
jgi:hypothetical protein